MLFQRRGMRRTRSGTRRDTLLLQRGRRNATTNRHCATCQVCRSKNSRRGPRFRRRHVARHGCRSESRCCLLRSYWHRVRFAPLWSVTPSVCSAISASCSALSRLPFASQSWSCSIRPLSQACARLWREESSSHWPPPPASYSSAGEGRPVESTACAMVPVDRHTSRVAACSPGPSVTSATVSHHSRSQTTASRRSREGEMSARCAIIFGRWSKIFGRWAKILSR